MGLTKDEIESRRLQQLSFEKNMRVLFSNLDHLRAKDKRGTWEKKLREVRKRWMIDRVFEDWMMHIIDVCYEKMMQGAGYEGVNETKKKIYR